MTAERLTCWMHSTVVVPATIVIGLPIGNEIPLCTECWDWWQADQAQAVVADPMSVPVWVKTITARSADAAS